MTPPNETIVVERVNRNEPLDKERKEISINSNGQISCAEANF